MRTVLVFIQNLRQTAVRGVFARTWSMRVMVMRTRKAFGHAEEWHSRSSGSV